MPKIIIKKIPTIKFIEGKFTFDFLRTREDIKSILNDIKNGVPLLNTFKSHSISEAVKRILIENSLIDDGLNLTAQGEAFLNHPIWKESEKGGYGIELITFEMDDLNTEIVGSLQRTLSNEKLEISQFSTANLISENQFDFKENDQSVFYLSKLSAYDIDGRIEGYVKETTLTESKDLLSFDLVAQKFTFKDKDLEMGRKLYLRVLNEIKTLAEKISFGKLDLNEQVFVINNMNSLKDEDLDKQKLSRFEKDGIYLEEIPLRINDYDVAQQYAYHFAFNKMNQQLFYNLNELNELFQNEIVNSPLFSENITSMMVTFQYNWNDFKRFLPTEKYDALAYKLMIIRYLEVEIEDDNFKKISSYKDLMKKFATLINLNEVKNLYLVMGYPFKKSSRNKLSEVITSIRALYNGGITIVKKGNYNETIDQELENNLKNQGINIFENSELIKFFHDRYIVFKLKDGTFFTYLVTCEISQFFNQDTSQSLGSIIKIDNQDVKHGSKNLFQMIGAL